MRTTGFLGGTLLAALLLSGCATAARSSSSAPRALVTRVQGSADVNTAGGDWRKAKKGQAILQGGRVRTGPNSQIDLDLGRNGGELTVMPDSLLEIEQLGSTEAQPDTIAVLNLSEGRITGDTLRPPGNKKIVVKTRDGVREIH